MFESVFMRLALIASIATGVSLGVMGVYLVLRRVVFLGLVVANAATLGSRARAGRRLDAGADVDGGGRWSRRGAR